MKKRMKSWKIERFLLKWNVLTVNIDSRSVRQLLKFSLFLKENSLDIIYNNYLWNQPPVMDVKPLSSPKGEDQFCFIQNVCSGAVGVSLRLAVGCCMWARRQRCLHRYRCVWSADWSKSNIASLGLLKPVKILSIRTCGRQMLVPFECQRASVKV